MADRELIVMRHAKSAWDTDAPTDFERPLSKRGRKDAPRMGEWLAGEGLIPDLVVTSPAERARTTAERVLRAMGAGMAAVRDERRIYDASLTNLLAVLAECPKAARRVLLVGHNPGLESLVLYLAGDVLPELGWRKVFPTAAVAHFRMPDDWTSLGPGAGSLASLVKPKMLKG
jgi:phosphohistidine phosphatase